MELYRQAKILFDAQPTIKPIGHMGVSCYQLNQHNDRQLMLFEETNNKSRKVADMMDKINDTYGEFTVVPGIMMEMDEVVLDRIAFGGVRELESVFVDG